MAYNDRGILRGKPADAPRENFTSSHNDNPELSTVDKTWGPLFDGDFPTDRFKQLARGIANHINNTPDKTLAIPPAKMVEFYTTYELDYERYSLKAIFQILSHEQISWIYRNLGCEHHLVPDKDLKKAPTIPALTPSGFNQWMTLFVLAYPDEESERLQKIVETMPIDADGVLIERKPERLPKQLSRYLLPPKGIRELKRLLRTNLSDLDDLVTSSQTSSTIPTVNSKPSLFSANQHQNSYSRANATLQPNISYKGQTYNLRHDRKASSTQQSRGRVYVHNSKQNTDELGF